MTATEQIQIGNQLFQQGQLEPAAAAYRQAIALDPDSVEAYQQLADILNQQGNLAEAAQCYRQAIALAMSKSSPKSPSTDSSKPDREVDARLQQAEQCMTQQQWQSAIALCQQSIEQAPSADAYKLMGNALQRSGQLDAALEAYQQALSMQPGWAEVYANLGSLSASQKQWEQAAAHYQTAIDLKPDFAGAYRNLARVWQQVNQSAQAAECWYQAAVLEPESLSAQEHVNLGNQLLELGQIEQAETCYRAAIDRDPNLVGAYQNLAKVLTRREQLTEAVTFYQKAIELHLNQPSTALATTTANPLREVADALQTAEQSDPDAVGEAIEQLEQKAEQLKPQAIAAYRKQASTAHANGDWNAAIHSYRRVVALAPDSAPDWGNLGTLYARLQQWQQAIACYHKAIALDENRAGFHWNLAQIWNLAGHPDLAAECYNQALNLDPKRASIEQHCNLGNVFLTQQKPQQAIACYQRALALKPDCLEAHYRLAAVLVEQGELVAATEHYQQAAALQPTDWHLQHQMGDVLSKQERYLEAVAAYRSAIQINPEFSWSHNNLGDALLKLEQWQDAVAAFRQAIVLKSDFHWSYYNLAEALTALEEWDEAVTAYRQADQLFPNHPPTLRKLNYALHRRARADLETVLGYYQQEIEHSPHDVQVYHRALEIERNHAELYFGLGQALEQQGESGQAIVCYNIALQQAPEQWQEALAAYSRVMKLSPNSPLVRQKLSDAYASLAQLAIHKALAHYQWAIQLDPDNSELYYQALNLAPDQASLYFGLADLLMKKGDRDGAILFYKKGLQFAPDQSQLSPTVHQLAQNSQSINQPIAEFSKKKQSLPSKFDWNFYTQYNEDLSHLSTHEEAHQHWLEQGLWEGRLASEEQFYETYSINAANIPPNFDWQEYRSLNPDLETVLTSKWRSIQHFITLGQSQGRLYSFEQLYQQRRQGLHLTPAIAGSKNHFDWTFYIQYNADLSYLPSYEEAFNHWIQCGQTEGRLGSEEQLYHAHNFSKSEIPLDFDWQEYLVLNPDLQSELHSKWDAIVHYIKTGQYERRIYALEQLHTRSSVAEKSALPTVMSEVNASTDASVEIPKPLKVAVLLHIYYFDLWDEICGYLQNLTIAFDLLINVVESVWTPSMHDRLRQDYPNAKILITPNRGRDIGGFLTLMGHLNFEDYDLFALLHTKKSPHLSQLISDQWRTDLYSSLLGTPEKINENLDIFRMCPDIGLLGSRYWRNTDVLNNSERYEQLLDEFEIAPAARECEFLAGTMMLIRPAIIQPLYEKFSDTELEDGDDRHLSFHTDGQIAHAVERLIGNLVKQQGMSFFWQD